MRLRTIGLISILALGLLVGPLTVEAQQAGKMPRIGYLRRSAGPSANTEAFLQGLRDLGWIEGKNIAIEYRWAEYKMDRLPALAEELVRLKVDPRQLTIIPPRSKPLFLYIQKVTAVKEPLRLSTSR